MNVYAASDAWDDVVGNEAVLLWVWRDGKPQRLEGAWRAVAMAGVIQGYLNRKIGAFIPIGSIASVEYQREDVVTS